MTKLTLYRQVRKDGGIRTGVEVNDEPVLGRFEQGDKETDSALDWYVDVRCSVSRLGNDPEDARRRLLEHAGAIQAALVTLAEELKVGMDFSSVLRRKVTGTPSGIQIEIVCSAVRRTTGMEMARVLSELGSQWQELVRRLPALEPTPA
jgi:hypothetical protein